MLFDAFELREMKLKNRIMMAPMCMYSAGTDGMAGLWHPAHYTARAVGGTGLIVTEAVSVLPEGRISEHDLGLWSDEHIEGLRHIVDLVHAHGAKIGVQLAHAGRKSETNRPDIYAPSAIPFDDKSKTPVAMSEDDIKRTVAAFGAAAARAARAGFDLVQIHAAHGYLLNEFLSPVTNKRTDAYGGGKENRARMLAEVIKTVRAALPEGKPFSVRVSADEYTDGGNTAQDVADILNLVKGYGVDAVNVSTGGVIPFAPRAFKGYQIPHAALIRRETGLPVTAGGRVTEAKEADAILTEGKADLVYLGMELLRNPYWPIFAAKELGADIAPPVQYERAFRQS